MYEITPILAGVRSADQGMMTYQTGYGKPVWLPMWAFLVRGGGLTAMVDTGLDDFVTPPGFTEQTGLTPVYLDKALKELGVDPHGVDMVINTHLHDDHCGNNQLFPNAVHWVQAAEVAFCKNPHPIDGRYAFELVEGCDLRELEGDAGLAEGIDVVFTPGHTPGSQTVVVETARAKVVISGMCSNAANFPASGAAVCPGVHTDAVAAWESAQRIAGLGGLVLPLHEVDVPALLAGK